jgi:hypothetical protein
MIVVAGGVSRAPIRDRAWLVCEQIPDRGTAAVFVDGTLDLIGRGGRALQKPVRKAGRVFISGQISQRVRAASAGDAGHSERRPAQGFGELAPGQFQERHRFKGSASRARLQGSASGARLHVFGIEANMRQNRAHSSRLTLMLVELTCYEVRRTRANGVNPSTSTPEDRTDSLALAQKSAHPTCALLCFDRIHCCGVVVAGLAGHAGARAD